MAKKLICTAVLTKLGYLIDNPWNNALDRAKAAGGVLAQLLIQRHLGVRPITLIGFSLGARVIFYALLELAKSKAFGIVQDVFLLGATLTASQNAWCETRSVVSGRFVNAYARNDWVLNYLFRATSAGLSTVAGLRPVENVPGLENVDVTDKISGHMTYRTFMPLILDQLGFPVSADYFDEPVVCDGIFLFILSSEQHSSHKEPEFQEERVVIRDEDLDSQKKGWFSSRNKKKPIAKSSHVSRPPSTPFSGSQARSSTPLPNPSPEDDLPPRAEAVDAVSPLATDATATPPERQSNDSTPDIIPAHAGFDLNAIREMIGKAAQHQTEALHIPETSEKDQVGLSAPQRAAVSAPPTPPPLIIQPLDEALSTNADVTLIGTSNIGRTALGSRGAHFSALSLRDQGACDSHGNENQSPMCAEEEGGDIGDGLARRTNIPAREFMTAPYTVTEEATWNAGTPGNLPPPGTTSGLFGNPFDLSADGVRSRPAVASASPPYSPPADPTASLSFGSLDGKITLHAVEQDPWSTPLRGKPLTGYLSNPWST